MRLKSQSIDKITQHLIIKPRIAAALKLEVLNRCHLIESLRARFGPEHLLTVGHRLVLQADIIDPQLPGIGWQPPRQQTEQRGLAAPVTAAYQCDAGQDGGRPVGEQLALGVMEAETFGMQYRWRGNGGMFYVSTLFNIVNTRPL